MLRAPAPQTSNPKTSDLKLQSHGLELRISGSPPKPQTQNIPANKNQKLKLCCNIYFYNQEGRKVLKPGQPSKEPGHLP